MYKAFINVGVYTDIYVRRYHYLYNIVTIPVNANVTHHQRAFRTTARTRRRAATRLRSQWNRYVRKTASRFTGVAQAYLI